MHYNLWTTRYYKDQTEFFNNNVLIDLNDPFCKTKEDDMFDQEILDNSAAWIIDAKYEYVDNPQSCCQSKTLKHQSTSQITKCKHQSMSKLTESLNIL